MSSGRARGQTPIPTFPHCVGEGGVGGRSLPDGTEEQFHAASVAGGGGAEVDDLGGAAAVHEADGAGVVQTLGGARAGAEAAMEAAAAVGHDKLKVQDLADFRRSQAGPSGHAGKVRATP
jgi:hypothetical protein